jgi:hypothetical protein
VPSSKTERAGKPSRVLPMFPELREHLQSVFDEAQPGTQRIITRYRLNNMNLRTQFERIVRKAGLSIGPKPFQNCRSTRATELHEDYPSHVVDSWLGHSAAVAAKHYLQTTDEHFNRAIGISGAATR